MFDLHRQKDERNVDYIIFHGLELKIKSISGLACHMLILFSIMCSQSSLPFVKQ